jgi:hypothetical protein
MTALFRGEYDPIEKFGVAMKQSEINAELAARGQNNLEGAARRNAEQIIRMELLYQRAADATGAFTGQAGNLFVEQKKLQAQFENMQASIGTQLLPVMGALVQALVPLVDYLGPKIAQAVNDSIPALEGFVGIIKDMSDKTTTTGQTMEFLTTTLGSFFGFVASNFGILVQLSLLIGGVTVSLQLFTAALTFITAHPIIATLTALAGLFLLVANANKNLTYDIDASSASVTSFNTKLDDSARASDYVSQKYGVVATSLKTAADQAGRLGDNLIRTTGIANNLTPRQADELARRAGKAAPVISSASTTTSSGGNAAEKAAKEAEKIAKELADAQEKAAKELQDALEEAARKEAEILKKREDAYKSFSDSVKSLFGEIKNSIMESFNLPDLGNSVNSITRNINKLLERTKNFARSITDLSAKGLNNTLLQQVIQAGPMAGGKLAQALLGGGADFINQINSAYNEFGGIASGIAEVGTTGAFKGQQTINNYSIEVTGGLATGSDVGRAVVNAIKDYERQSGAAWRA